MTAKVSSEVPETWIVVSVQEECGKLLHARPRGGGAGLAVVGGSEETVCRKGFAGTRKKCSAGRSLRRDKRHVLMGELLRRRLLTGVMMKAVVVWYCC